MRTLAAIALLLLTAIAAGSDEQVFESEAAFVTRAFAGAEPQAQTLWVQGALRERLEDALGERVGLRLRYWLLEGRSAWVLDRVGKDHPITSGFVVGASGIEQVAVLIFRESRGWEVKHDFFTRQFLGGRLNDRGRLDRTVNNITGATLSVQAMQRMARAALILHEQVAPPLTDH